MIWLIAPSEVGSFLSPNARSTLSAENHPEQRRGDGRSIHHNGQINIVQMENVRGNARENAWKVFAE